MLRLEKEQPADQIFGRTQWWRRGEVTYLVRFTRDEERCGVYISGDSAERLFGELGLEHEHGFSLEPGIDCFAIGCPSSALGGLLDRLGGGSV